MQGEAFLGSTPTWLQDTIYLTAQHIVAYESREVTASCEKGDGERVLRGIEIIKDEGFTVESYYAFGLQRVAEVDAKKFSRLVGVQPPLGERSSTTVQVAFLDGKSFASGPF